MVSLTSNRPRYCKSNLGGVKAIYIAPYRKLLRSEISYDGVTLLSFPETFFYTFELVRGSEFRQQQNQNEGGKYFDVSITVNINKITAFDNLNFQRLLKKDYFLIVQDGNDNYFLMGFRNGVTADSLKTSTTQYTIEFSGMEEEFAPFVTGLIGNDIIIVPTLDYVFQDGRNFIFQDDKNYIFQ